MAAGSTVTAMKTAVRRGAAAATLGQARRRYLIGGRPLASSKPRMNGRDEVDTLSEITDKMMQDMMKRGLLGASIQEFISDHRKMVSPRLGIPLLVGGLFVSGFTIGYNMKTSFNAAKRQ